MPWRPSIRPAVSLRTLPGVLLSLAGSSGAFGAPPFPASINLSALNGTDGFVINGINFYDYSGRSVSSAGDINGDGFGDIIIGAHRADLNSQYDQGQSYIVFGGPGVGASGSVELSSLNGTNGFVCNGIDDSDRSGHSVSSAGDVNGDGVHDLIIGAYGADPNGTSSGESYVVFGHPGIGVGGSLELAALDGTNGFVLNGIAAGDGCGGSVSAAGDVNGDGIDDLLIGAYFADPGGVSYAGETYVVFGGPGIGTGGAIDLASLNGTNGFSITGIAAGDRSGRSIAAAGDINGDGLGDIIIGADRADPSGVYDAGESYIVFGSATIGSSGALALSAIDGTNGLVLRGVDANDRSGISASSAGDFNADGVDDVIIGAFMASPSGVGLAGESYVVFGGTGIGASGAIDLTALDGTNGLVMKGIDANDRSGRSVSGAGDINGDGVSDIIIGAYRGDGSGAPYAGESYVVFGGAGIGASGALSLSTLNGATGVVFRGTDASDFSGRSVSSACDINGDGVDDVIVGAFRADPGGRNNAGETYVVFGRLVANVWGNVNGGNFGVGTNWMDGAAPGPGDIAMIDNVVAGLPDASFTLILPQPKTINALKVRTDDVTLNLNGSGLALATGSSAALPGITVGGRIEKDARLRLFNSQLLQTFVTANDVAVGPVHTSALIDPLSRLTVDGSSVGLAVSNRLLVGYQSPNAQCWIVNGADATVAGELHLGVEPGSDGQLRIAQGGSTLTLIPGALSIVIGDAGDASVEITSSGGLESSTTLVSTTIADGPASVASILIDGVGSRWISAQSDLIIGGGGTASIEIRNGAELRTDTTNQLVVARDAGSSSEIVISGVGSNWTELTQSIAVGGEGSATVRFENGASLSSIVGVNVRSLGTLAGSGAINAPIVTSFGTLDPGTSGAAGALQINGSYRQTGTPPGGAAGAGAVDLDVFGTFPFQFDQLTVTGDIELAGRLRITFAPGFMPTPAALDQLELVSGGSNFEASRFDVALMPNLGSSNFLTVAYGAGGARSDGSRSGVSVSLQVNPLTGDITLDPEPAVDSGTAGVPQGATLADIDGDDDPDLLIALPDAANPTTAPGSVVILYNADDGNPGNGWEGFGQTLQITAGVGVNPSSVAVGRLDADAQPDIIVSNRGTPGNAANDTVSVLLVLNPGAGTFALSASPMVIVGDEPADVIVADLDGDGFLDIATANAGSHSVSVGWNTGLGIGPGWIPITTAPLDLPDDEETPVSIRPGDTNAGTSMFLATANLGTNTIGLIQVNPNRSISVLPSIPAGNAPVEVVIADFNLDGRDDVATVNRDDNSVSIALNESVGAALAMGAKSDLPIDATISLPRSITIGDYDADGDTDIAVLADGVVKVLRNDLSGGQLAFAPIADQPGGTAPLLVRSGDLDVDGKTDVVTVAESTGGARSANRGVTDSINTLLATTPPSCLGDVNGDGLTNAADFTVLAGNFGSSVAPSTSGDLNGDGLVNAADFVILAGDFGCGAP